MKGEKSRNESRNTNRRKMHKVMELLEKTKEEDMGIH
jgi:hypothetical protein